MIFYFYHHYYYIVLYNDTEKDVRVESPSNVYNILPIVMVHVLFPQDSNQAVALLCKELSATSEMIVMELTDEREKMDRFICLWVTLQRFGEA